MRNLGIVALGAALCGCAFQCADSWLLSGSIDGLDIRVSREAGRLMTDPFRRARPAVEAPNSAA
jgi:hypothetical protein